MGECTANHGFRGLGNTGSPQTNSLCYRAALLFIARQNFTHPITSHCETILPL